MTKEAGNIMKLVYDWAGNNRFEIIHIVQDDLPARELIIEMGENIENYLDIRGKLYKLFGKHSIYIEVSGNQLFIAYD